MNLNNQNEFQIEECNDVLCSIVRNNNCPEDILIELSNSNSFDVKKGVIHNPNCPTSILDKFTNGDTINLLMLEVLKKSNCPIHLFDKVISKLSSNFVTKSEVFSIIAKNPTIEKEDFEKQICSKFTWTKDYTDCLSLVAKNPRCPTEVLDKLYKNLEIFDIYPTIFEDVMSSIASNPKCSRELLNMFAKSTNSKIRKGAAKNSNLPVELIEKLSSDKNITVVAEIASKPTCPENILRELYKMDNIIIKLSLASNTSLHPDLISALAEDRINTVRAKIAKNPNCSLQYYSIFLNDKSPDVIASFMSRKNMPNWTSWMIKNVIDNPHTEVRIAVSSNNNLDKHEMEILSKDQDDRVRENLAKNPSCSSDILLVLARDKNRNVVKAAIKNPNCPVSILIQILENKDIELIKCVLEVLNGNSFEFKREYNYYHTKLLLLENNNIKEEKLMNLIKNSDSRIRLLVAEYEHSSQFVLKKLASDPDNTVRKVAESNLRRITSYLKFKSLAGENKQVQKQTVVQEENINYIEELSNNKKEEETKVEELRSLIFESLARNKELNERLGLLSTQEKLRFKRFLKIRIPENELFIKVQDHYEIKEEYIPYLEQIDFVLLNTENLKVSGIDWSNSNINIDPQKVYNRDLSYAKFADNNITFKNFDGCILIGTDLSEEIDSYGFETAIIDENTKLPKNKRGLK